MIYPAKTSKKLVCRMNFIIINLVVELLSEGTEKEDLGQTVRDIKQPPTKWQVYEQILQIPYYIVFGRISNELRVFHWQAGLSSVNSK